MSAEHEPAPSLCAAVHHASLVPVLAEQNRAAWSDSNPRSAAGSYSGQVTSAPTPRASGR